MAVGRPPWRLQDLADDIFDRSSRPSVAASMPPGGPTKVELSKKFDSGWWVVHEGLTTRPQVIFWPMFLGLRPKPD